MIEFELKFVSHFRFAHHPAPLQQPHTVWDWSPALLAGRQLRLLLPLALPWALTCLFLHTAVRL